MNGEWTAELEHWLRERALEAGFDASAIRPALQGARNRRWHVQHDWQTHRIPRIDGLLPGQPDPFGERFCLGRVVGPLRQKPGVARGRRAADAVRCAQYTVDDRILRSVAILD